MFYATIIRFAQAIQDEVNKFTGDEVPIPMISADQSAVQTILQIVFGVIGGLSLLFVVIGALKYVTSSGDPGGIQSAKDTILYAIIGLVLALMAFTIVGFVFDNV